jgi:CRISPR system Cascade subunit CasC
MLVELHILQNFAPSNLNRDDTGSPKDCEFGGYRRARISSQCFKRAIRMDFRARSLMDVDTLAVRTKRLVDEVAERLVARGRDGDQARAVIESALGGLGLKFEEGRTQYLLFLGGREIEVVADVCDQYWEKIPAGAAVPTGDADTSARARKKVAKEAVPSEVKTALRDALDGGRAADLALFGRMLADVPDLNVDAASQVAHAISTNRVSMEFDYFTAVDDLQPEENTGAGMIGTVEFNSACFYRYANVDMAQLTRNLNDDASLAVATLEAFIRASVSAIPSGKQNSMAAQNAPALVFAVVREHGFQSLANAFLQPVFPAEGKDLVTRSVMALDTHWRQLTGMYGTDGIKKMPVATYADDALDALKGSRVAGVEALVADVLEAVR